MIAKKTSALALAAVGLSAAGIGMFPGSPARAQNPPVTPFQLVSQLDLECRHAEGPPIPNVFIRQLNPVLQDKLPNQAVDTGPLEEVCVPVAKNGNIPGPAALEFARWVDVACYAANAAPVDVEVKLSQLNPVLAALPDENVKLVQLRQLCVPVRKNNNDDMPDQVRRFVSHFDLACYELEQPTADANTTLQLTHLNPVIRAFNWPDRIVEMHRAPQLCVPVAKNAQPVPDGVSEVVRWADFLKYRTEVVAGAVPIPLWLNHMNPLFQGLPGFNTVLTPPIRLMVPVAKDGHIPPGGPTAN